MNAEQQKRYSTYRSQGIAAIDAARMALQANEPAPLEWHNDMAVWKQDGFTLIANRVQDKYGDTSWLGEFSACWSATAIKRKPSNACNRYPYFEPQPGLDVRSITRDLRKLGYGKHAAYTAARKQVLHDLDRLEQYQLNYWSFVTIVVSAKRCGITLGEATLSGIEDDSASEYFAEVAHELATHAIDEAKQTIHCLTTEEED